MIQRFGAAASLNVQFQGLALDGACRIGADGRPRLMAVAAPTPARLHALPAAMIARLMRLFVRRGVVVAEPDDIRIEEAQAQAQDGDDATDMAPTDGLSALPLLNQASTTYPIATGSQAGRRIARIGGSFCAAGRGGGKPLCAEIAGFDLHAATRCRTDDRHRLVRLCRPVMRPALVDDRCAGSTIWTCAAARIAAWEPSSPSRRSSTPTPSPASSTPSAGAPARHRPEP
jgi:hypothetical protein